MIKIIVGTETGTAEYVADEVLDLLGEHDLNAEVIDQISELSLDDTETLVICTSTHGAGEVPNNLKKFEQWLQTSPNLENKKFAVIGLGDSSYDTFCQAAKSLDELLSNANANRMFTPIFADAMSDELPEDIVLLLLKAQLDKFV
ncbi:flavodoxin domain-containing protein [Psychrosphaera haliotis]|uniref:FMN-binding protein MioC n=1 Tax=Psychrosphaera haliotis TaxID=555083 RepID=A0A6N8FD63_9GAMM|nr:flavodoxin domain-containing protein [Psychrosphaera haliotis]MUH73529.1 FMN-binding protein MioC [Psychrosphaera haliotis]